MATFRFNFLQEEADHEPQEAETNEREGDDELLQDHGVRIVMEPEEKPNKLINTLQFNDHLLYRLDDEDSSSDYDLIPGTYEGGRRIWECSLDLVHYIFEVYGSNSEVKSVLELGCGHGLPGVAAGKCGFSPIIFSDFNDDVLETLTWPTVALNISKESRANNVICLAGDWRSVSRSLLQGSLPYPATYDLILSAETLYNLEAVHKVYEFLSHHLSDSGIALIASKRYYFGVGGGVRDFLHLISQPISPLTARVVRVFDDGQSNIREIVEVARKERR